MNSYPHKPVVDRPKTISQGGCHVNRILGLLLLLICSVGVCLQAAAANYKAISVTLLPNESCAPANGYIDPGETDTVLFAIQNKSGGDLKNVKVTLNGAIDQVVWPLEGQKTIGDIAKDGVFTVNFNFRANSANCGGVLQPDLSIVADNLASEHLVFSGTNPDTSARLDFQLGATVTTPYSFSNNSAIAINDFTNQGDNPGLGKASPYPATVSISGVPNVSGLIGERVTGVSVTLNNVTHAWSPNVQVLLVSPQKDASGKNIAVILMANAGGVTQPTAPINNVTLTFSDSASGQLPHGVGASQITSGTYKPSNFSAIPPFGANDFPGAPTGSIVLKNLSDLSPSYGANAGFDLNGTWSLYVQDAVTTGSNGSIAGGWRVDLTTTKIVCCGAGQTAPAITGIADTSVDEDAATPDHPITIANFTIFDLESGADQLTLSAASSNSSIVDAGQLAFGGSGASRNLQLKQNVLHASGDTTILVTVTDPQGHTAQASFKLTVKFKNHNPSVSQVVNQAFPIGQQSPPIPFTLDDVEEGGANLLITVNSSDITVVPIQNIFVPPTGSSRTVTVTPASGSTSGTTTITLTAHDSNGGTTDMSFVVAFKVQAGFPSISPFNNQTVKEDAVLTVPFTVRSGSSTPANSLTLSYTSSNPSALSPTSPVVFGGSDTARTVTFSPSRTLTGDANTTIRITVTDPNNTGRTDFSEFVVTAQFVNQNPTITSIPNQFITATAQNGTGDLGFTVGDVETRADLLTLSAKVISQSNPNLIVSPNSPGGQILFGPATIPSGSGARTVKVLPTTGQFGTIAVQVTVSDGNSGSASTTFIVNVSAVNVAPTMTDPGTVHFAEDSGTLIADTGGAHNVTFTMQGISPGAANEASQTVSISASSSDSSIVAIDKVDPSSVTGVGKSSTLTLRLQPHKNTPDALKPIVITITLTDNGGTDFGGANTATFKLNVVVDPVNYAPTLTVNPNNTIDLNNVPKNKPLAVPVGFTDTETPTALMTLTGRLLLPADGSFPADSDNVVQGVIADPLNSQVTLLLAPVFTGATLAHLHPNGYTLAFRLTGKDVAVGGAAQNTVTKDFTITIKDIEPATLILSTVSVTVPEDNVGLSVLTLHDNADLSTELRPLTALSAGCKASVGFSTELSAHSDNQTLVPDDTGVLFGNLNQTGTFDGTRTIAIVPALHKFGTANITITAVDAECIPATITLKITVTEVPHPPSITLLKAAASGTVSVNEDGTTKDDNTDSKLLELDVDDVDSGPATVTVTADSDNHTLVPVANIVVGNQGATSARRTLTITPGTHQFGTAKITLTVRDPGGLNSSASFNLVVNHVNQPPTIDQVANISLPQDVGQQTVTLTGVYPGPDNEKPSGQDPQILHNAGSITWDARDKGTRTDSADGNNTLILGESDVNPVNSSHDISSTYDPSTGKATLKFTPKLHASGTATIYVTVTDHPGDGTAVKTTKMQFDVAIAFANHAPTISFSAPPNAAVTTTGVTTSRAVDGTPQQSPVVAVYINDIEQANGNGLTLTATSSNPLVVPNDATHILLGGSGTVRGVSVLPAPGQLGGTTTITLTVADQNGATAQATLNVTVPNSEAPSISTIPNQAVHVNEFTDLVFFTVADAKTPADQLQVFAANSSNTAVVPLSSGNIQFGGSGSSRAMIVLPAKDQTGSSIITVSVKDGDGNVTSTSFTLTVLGQPPTITKVSDQTIGLSQKGSAQSFTVNSANTFPGFLTVTPKSSNQDVVPDSNIFILGSTGTRSVTVLAGNKSGTAIITLTVSDNSGQSASSTFVVSVLDNNTAPTISTIGAQSTRPNTPTGLITFVVGDAESAPGSLQVTATSGNTDLVNTSTGVLILQSPSNPASRSMIITPSGGKTGTALITVTVTDGGGKTASTSFAINVNAVIVSNDFNGDGVPDIILQDNDGFVGAWFMSADIEIGATFLTPNNVGDKGWKVIDSGDFDGDGKPDLLFQYSDGTLAVWKMDGTKLISASALDPSNSGSPDWQAIAVADFNGDGKPDILLQNTNGSLAVWIMNGLKMSSISALVPSGPGDPNWRAVGVADLNGDKNLDIIFQHADGTLGVWYLKGGTNLLLSALLNPSNPGSADWRVVGTTDLNGDGKADLLLQNRATGDVGIWFMKGPDLILGKTLTPTNPGGSWHIVAP